MSIKIDAGVPMPKGMQGRLLGAQAKAFIKMNMGDSFVTTKKKVQNLRVFAKKSGYKVAARQETANSYRVWKMAADQNVESEQSAE